MFDSERFEPQGAEDAQDEVAQMGRSVLVATGIDTMPRGDDAREHLLRLWRNAAQVVRTDPVAARRAAYEAAIDEVLEQLPSLRSFEALMDSYGTISRAAIEVMAAHLRRDGRLVNEQVVAGAACWAVLSSQVEMRASRPS